MINNEDAHVALRNRALGVVVATTGLTSLSVTVDGYARLTGSFVTDGFSPGMEVLGNGFTTPGNNAVAHIVTEVTPLLLKCGGVTAELAAGGRSVSCGFPLLRSFENVNPSPGRTAGRPYIEEEYVPGTSSLLSFPAQGAHAEDTGLYILKWYGLSGQGIPALRRAVDALRALFAPGTTLIAGSATLRIREGANAPYTGQIIPLDGGWSVLMLTIPWHAYTINVVAP